jgi:ABC-type bacteriocin/lantibiotic exporter with double-glycine peptidase domain
VGVTTDTRIHGVSTQPWTHSPLAGAARFLAYLLTYLRPYRLSFAVVVAGSLLDSALNAVIPLSFKFMIDRAVGGKTRYVLFLPLIVSFAVIIIS